MFRSIRIILIIVAIAAGSSRGSLPGENPNSYPMSVVSNLIDEAANGAVIRIPAGVYKGNLIVRKPVVLDGGSGAVLDGQGDGTVIEVLADDVTIRGCTIRASGQDVTGEPSAIRVIAARAVIESNSIEDALFGIDLREAPDARIRNNTITGKDLEPGRRGDGIRLWWSHGCSVDGNVVRASRDMVFWYSEDLRITRNTVSDSRYGLHFMYSHGSILSDNELRDNSVGVYLMYSNGITLRNNRMLNNRGASGYGIGLKDCDDIAIIGNALLANRVGVYIDNSPSSIDSTGLFDSNTVAFNEIGLLATPNTHDNVFTSNAFIENEQHAATHGRGRLISNRFAENDTGNYWSDYTGFDLDRDGIGDIRYEPRSMFDAMLADEPNLRLFVHSPAQQAIEFTSRALPELRPEPTLTDPHPLVSVPGDSIVTAGPRIPSGGMAWLAGSLLGGALATVVLMSYQNGLPGRQTGASRDQCE